MASIPGSIPISGLLAPSDETDTYAITDPQYGLGGLRTVADLEARNAISLERRQHGMLAYVEDLETYYKLEEDLETWSVFAVGTIGEFANRYQFPTDEAINAGRVITVNEFGLARHADKDDPTLVGKSLGISATATGIGGGIVNVAFDGPVNTAAGSIGDRLFLGSNGIITTALPTSGIRQQVGVKINSTEMLINLDQPTRLL